MPKDLMQLLTTTLTLSDERPNGNGRNLNIPADFLPNPVLRPVQ